MPLEIIKGADGWVVIGDEFFVVAETKKEALQKYKRAVAAMEALEPSACPTPGFADRNTPGEKS